MTAPGQADEYTPSEAEVRAALATLWKINAQMHPTAFDRFLASIRGEAHKSGYRLGYEAGRLSDATEQAKDIAAGLRSLAGEKPSRVKPTADRRCDCGHVDTTHNELGYCQARGKRGSDGCHCGNFTNDLDRARTAERVAARRAAANQTGEQKHD